MPFKDPEKLKQYKKEYYQKNKERSSAVHKAYYLKHRDTILQRTKNWGSLNKVKKNQSKKKHREKYREQNRVYQREYEAKRRVNDLFYKIRRTLSGRLNSALKSQGLRKTKTTLSLVECSLEDLKKHLESKFHINTRTGEAMTWLNHGPMGWHIDHIIPCAKFNLVNEEEQKKCFHWTNLQPLWWWENLEKKDK